MLKNIQLTEVSMNNAQRLQLFQEPTQRPIKRSFFNSARTAMIVFLDKDEQKVREQLTFYWRGLTENIYIVGGHHHKTNKIYVSRLIKKGGGGFAPLCYFQENSGLSNTRTQTKWFISCLDRESHLDNIIINSAEEIPFGFVALATALLPKRYGEMPVNFYHTTEIERRKR